MSNAYKHPLRSTSKPRLFPKILHIYNRLHTCTAQYNACWKNTISSRSWQLLSWSRYLPPFVKPEGLFLRYSPQRYATFEPSCQWTHNLEELNPLPPRILHSVVIFSRCCKRNLTLKQLNPLPFQASTTASLNYHYPITEPLLWSKWMQFPPSYPPHAMPRSRTVSSQLFHQ